MLSKQREYRILKQLLQQQKLTSIAVLHDINLAARYSDRLALLKQGNLFTLGTPKQVLIPENLAQVFGIDVAILQTPVGLQICPLASRKNV